MTTFNRSSIKAIVGLGNPGPRFELTRHNAGFLVLDEIAERCGASWQTKDKMEVAEAQMMSDGVFTKLWLIKPQTFMNDSGKVMGFLSKKGIEPDQIVVVHDELEKPFGHVSVKVGGSARGHNGLRSIIAHIGADFWRIRVGIGRPEKKSDVSNYVLQRFAPDELDALEGVLKEAADIIS